MLFQHYKHYIILYIALYTLYSILIYYRHEMDHYLCFIFYERFQLVNWEEKRFAFYCPYGFLIVSDHLSNKCISPIGINHHLYNANCFWKWFISFYSFKFCGKWYDNEIVKLYNNCIYYSSTEVEISFYPTLLYINFLSFLILCYSCIKSISKY